MSRGIRVFGPSWLLLVGLVCPAQDQGGAPITLLAGVVNPPLALSTAQDSTPNTIHGTVVNSITGEPIYRALVQIGGEYAALTDHEGHFEFDGTIPQGVPPWAMKPGYFPEERFQQLSAATLTASFNESLVVKLVPEAIISGTVTGQDGNPLEGIPVQLKAISVEDGLSRWRQHGQTRTNSEGQYRFAELQAGKYQVTTGFHTEGLADSDSAVGYVPARYPPPAGGPTAPESAIIAKAGDHLIADLNPEMEKLFPVTGVVSGYGEGRGATFRVETSSGEEFTPVARFLARTGEFRLLLPAGSYKVTATAYTRQGPFEARRELTVQGPASGVSFAMGPYASIPVELQTDAVNQSASGQSATGTSAVLGSFAGNISLTSSGSNSVTPFLAAHPVSRAGTDGDETGPMVIDNIAPGRYVLRAQPPSPWYVASAACGGLDLTHDELLVGGGSVGCSIRVVLRNDSGSAHVTVRDSASTTPSTGQRALYVYALPQSNFAQPIVMLNQQNGEYSADGLAPGRYLLLALDHREELPYRDPEAMRRYAGLGQEIAVTANGKADAEISVATVSP